MPKADGVVVRMQIGKFAFVKLSSRFLAAYTDYDNMGDAYLPLFNDNELHRLLRIGDSVQIRVQIRKTTNDLRASDASLQSASGFRNDEDVKSLITDSVELLVGTLRSDVDGAMLTVVLQMKLTCPAMTHLLACLASLVRDRTRRWVCTPASFLFSSPKPNLHRSPCPCLTYF
jgi:hypothetical protein